MQKVVLSFRIIAQWEREKCSRNVGITERQKYTGIKRRREKKEDTSVAQAF